MDHQAFAQLLGNYGEFIGAVAVVVTLIFLTLQIRQNTLSNDANRKVALAQTYQARAALFIDILLRTNDEGFASVERKYRHASKVSDPGTAIRELSSEERFKYASLLSAMRTYTDNIFYQHQLGLLDDEYYEWGLPSMVEVYGHQWKDWGLSLGRKSFADAVNDILED